MRYVSTRGGLRSLDFEQAMMTGLARRAYPARNGPDLYRRPDRGAVGLPYEEEIAFVVTLVGDAFSPRTSEARSPAPMRASTTRADDDQPLGANPSPARAVPWARRWRSGLSPCS